MKATKRRSEEERPREQGRAGGPLDSGEFRAIMLAAAGLAFFLYFIKLMLLPFVLAAIIAYVCTPLLDWAAKRTRWPRLLFAVVLFLVLFGIGSLTLALAATRLAEEVRSTAADLQSMAEHFVQEATGNQPISLLGHSMTASQIAQTVLNRIGDWIGQTDRLALVAGYSLAAIMGAFLTVVLLFYFLASGPSVARGLLWIVPPHRRELVRRIWARLDPVLMRYFLGVAAVVVYATVAAYIGLGLILGIQHAVLLAMLTGILETVPVIGPTSAAVIAGMVALRSATSIMSIVAYALYATVLRLSIDQLFGPLVLGRAAHVHPVLIIFCFLAGGIVLGIPGVILAVPVALLIKSTLATLYGDDNS